jgi:hypothetical protein
MRRAVSSLTVCAGLWLFAVGCATRSPNPTAAPPPLPAGGGTPLLTDDQVTVARTLFVAKCTSCHKFYPPAKYSEAEWNSWMRKMSRKSKLKPAEEERLRNYLSLFRR